MKFPNRKCPGQALIEYLIVAFALVLGVFNLVQHGKFQSLMQNRTQTIGDFLKNPIP